MKYILLFIIISVSIQAQEIKSVSESSFEVFFADESIQNSNQIFIIAFNDSTDITSIKLTLPTNEIDKISASMDFKNFKKSNNYYIIGKNQNLKKLKVTGLPSNKLFTIYAFVNDGNTNEYVWRDTKRTKALEPQKSPTGIIFKNTGTDNLSITWKDAEKSDGTLLLISKDKPVSPPTDFTEYKIDSKFGSNISKVGSSTFAVFKGKKPYAKFLQIDNLEFGTYYVQAFSYNGQGESINYNLVPDKNNPRSVQTKLRPPVLNEDAEFTDEFFEISWNRVEGCEYFELQASYDLEFNHIVDNYDIVNVGNITTYGIFMEHSDRTYFIRVRAINGRNKSEWSEIKEFED